MAKQSVLITGAAGLVGSHLTEKFLAEGFAVLGVDNFLTGREENLALAHKHSDFRFEQKDVTQDFDFVCPTGGRFFQVLHFACPASPVDFATLPLEILEVDSRGTINALKFAREHSQSFLMASTSEAYGDPLVHPQTEEYWGNVNPVGTRACYDEAKRFSEAATTVFHCKYGLDTKIVRIFNTYGPRNRLNDGRVVPELCRQALSGEPLTLHGDGLQTRSFCYVEDLVNGIFLLSQSQSEHLPVNIGNPNEYTIKQFAEEIGNVLGQKLEFRYLPARPDDPRRRCPDITKARKLLGWEPKISLSDGLKMTLAGFRQELGL